MQCLFPCDACVIGASLMILGGRAEVFLGVKAERKGVEEIASPLSAEDADRSVGAWAGWLAGDPVPSRPRGRRATWTTCPAHFTSPSSPSIHTPR